MISKLAKAALGTILTGQQDIDRAISPIRSVVNQTTAALNAATFPHKVPMGSMNGTSCTAGTWTNLLVDNAQPYYYRDTDTVSLYNIMLVLNSSSAGNAQFRIIRANTPAATYLSPVVVKGTVNIFGPFALNTYQLLGNATYTLQVNAMTTGAIYAMAIAKVMQ